MMKTINKPSLSAEDLSNDASSVIHDYPTKGQDFGPWRTPGITAKLKHYNATTRMSMAEIANALSEEFKVTINRSMVIGKINRLDIRYDRPILNKVQDGNKMKRKIKPAALKAKMLSCPPIRRSVPIADVAPTLFGEVVPIRGDVADGVGVSILELTAETCRWPLSMFHDRPPYRYCGEKSDGSPYCAYHTRLALNRPL